MKTNYKKRILQTSAALAIVAAAIGCGEDPGAYHGETLAIENPVSSKRVDGDNPVPELDLGENQKSDFGFLVEPFGYYPWGPFPFFDYYLEPVPFAVPVSPGYAVLDYVHPFYANAFFNPFWGDDDDHSFHDDD